MTDKIKVTTKKKTTAKRVTKASSETPTATSVATAPKRAPASKASTAPPTREEIAARAHDLYVNSGHQGGREVEFWLEAERQLKDKRNV